MNRKPPTTRLMVLGVVAAAVALVLGCSPSSQPAPGDKTAPSGAAEEKPQYGGIFINRTTADPPGLDIQRESDSGVTQPISAAYAQIVRYAPLEPDKIVPDLAERWEFSPDGKTLTFYIRKGVKFHNDDDLTSADIKFTLDRVRGAITQGPGALATPPRKVFLTVVDRIETPDDYTVVLRLQNPTASLLKYLATVWNPVYDKKWVEAGHDPGKEVNGAGEFKLNKYIRGTSFELVKNDKYWNPGLPYLDGSTHYIIPDANTAVAALRAGKLTIAQFQYLAGEEATLGAQIETGDLATKYKLVSAPQGQPAAQVWFNTTRKPFDDPRLRRAVSMALDRREILKLQEGGTPRPGSTVFGWLLPRSYWELPAAELAKIPGFNPDKAAERADAKKLLAEAGYPNGLNIKTFVVPTSSIYDVTILQVAQLKTVGINVELEPIDVAPAYDRLTKGDYQLAFQRANSGNTEDPDTFYGKHFLCGSSRNYSQFCDPKWEALYTKQSQTLDPEARKKIVWEMEKYIWEQAPTLSDSSALPQLHAVSKQLRGWAPHPVSHNQYRLDTVWLAK